MINAIFLGAASALWLGVLTSISPCPLATNVAAVSFIGKQFSSAPRVALSGLFYVLGRMLAYLVLGTVLVAGLLAAPQLSAFLQQSMNKFLGPILILVGMVLLDLFRFRLVGADVGANLQERAGRGGVLGAGLLGFLFALSFCPVSAALFFGSLIPLSVQHGSAIVFPLVFGVGTGLPVIVFALMIALGAKSIGLLFRKVTRVELWARRITGAVFIAAGTYYALVYIFEVL
jgi:cytochrome c biogenesis protein CcdA